MDEICKGEIKARILETEHKIIKHCNIFNITDTDRECIKTTAYISGINAMAKALIDEMCGDEDG